MGPVPKSGCGVPKTHGRRVPSQDWRRPPGVHPALRLVLAAILLPLLLPRCSTCSDVSLPEEDTVQRLDPAKLHVTYAPGTVAADGPLLPRAYTLTHSDSTGELYLTIGPAYDERQISGWYTRLMRDEVLAEWVSGDLWTFGTGSELHVHCHVSGGLAAGSAGWRDAIFRRELPLVLEAFRFGDRALLLANPELDQAPIFIHFHSSSREYDRIERWGTPSDYR